MSTFNQKLDSMKESLASLFKSRRTSKSSQRTTSTSSTSSNNATVCPTEESGSATTANTISTPQNVRRVLHITFDAGRQSFSGIPEHWRSYFGPADSHSFAETLTEAVEAETPPGAVRTDDSGVSMATSPKTPTSADQSANEKPLTPPKELLSLTYDRNSGKFVDLPPHWQDRLERNNLLEPEFQKNPELLVSVFAMMDEELKAMSLEGISLDKGMYSSSPASSKNNDGLNYVYEIAADSSNSSSEQDLQQQQQPEQPTNQQPSNSSWNRRRPSLVRMRAVAAPSLK
ncbi:hypothetical protein BOX15_Mlig019290g2 [Macrostomum lignano]|uniref:CRIB domain-containing protein n=2 Tax=Macrostomum lignano TaxID=282301 RepID=A0A1I8GUM9_9PLAT|nr:hypothetical protein BOX15_Mlig019290g3 [Macrostomum lignano]PAA90854.1 hypothetical protein BOX15_Mlig019290g1 [Macrostomum lignano]PAA90862.1 hypothetical protein BOX15_Mlig019290g2 [Macrostomum lignano]